MDTFEHGIFKGHRGICRSFPKVGKRKAPVKQLFDRHGNRLYPPVPGRRSWWIVDTGVYGEAWGCIRNTIRFPENPPVILTGLDTRPRKD
jgi:hypothetical protein